MDINYTNLGDALKAIIDCHGPDILKEGKKLCAVLGDIAPTLTKERKILRRAYEESVFVLFLEAAQAPKNERSYLVAKIEAVLKGNAGFSGEWCNIVMTAFSKAFGWEDAYSNTTTPLKTNNTPKNKSNHEKVFFTKNRARNVFPSIPQRIIIPEQYTVIGSHVFEYLMWTEKVQTIIVPNSITEIQDRAFDKLKVTQYIQIPNSVERIGREAFVLEKGAYVKCEKGSFAHQYCIAHGIKTEADDVVISKYPSKLTQSDASHIEAKFSDERYRVLLGRMRELSLPLGTISVEKGAFRGRNDFDVLVGYSGLRYIKQNAFRDCKDLKYAFFAEGLEGIASEAFADCISLELVYIDTGSRLFDHWTTPDGYIKTDISATAFDGCESLRYIVTSAYVEDVGEICEMLGITYIWDDIIASEKSPVEIPEQYASIYHVFRAQSSGA